jgi:heme oxygenase
VHTYVDRLAYLGRPDASPEEVALLVAHAYVRYLGYLSGGEAVRRKISKAYQLYDHGDGIAFYNFNSGSEDR